ncbi:MAG: hypothetical protein QM451_10720 [Bacillota bacterium]|jgi:hypothetical protein|nr:hypothetical protein [Bacillota bacterium]HHT90544.1 hypothetical protein [Bacillota bacterium]
MSKKSLLLSIVVTSISLLFTNRFLFKESWIQALRGGILVAVGSLVTAALVVRNGR